MRLPRTTLTDVRNIFLLATTKFSPPKGCVSVAYGLPGQSRVRMHQSHIELSGCSSNIAHCTMTAGNEAFAQTPELAAHRRCLSRLREAWPAFCTKRRQRLEQQQRLGDACEKVAENILEDLFTIVLDWPLADLNNQLDRADIVLTDHGIKRLVVEVKRPFSLAWNHRALHIALEQALRYASEQKVRRVAISDGVMLYAADVADGGIVDRLFVPLHLDEPQDDLWWLSVQGIWRQPAGTGRARLRLLSEPSMAPDSSPVEGSPPARLLHPKYHRPAGCFAYVGDYARTSTWKLPYLLEDGSVDAQRLPKAVQCILSNYRGAKVSGIPEAAIPAVLLRLAETAARAGHLPPAAANPAPVYQQLLEALDQLAIPLEHSAATSSVSLR